MAETVGAVGLGLLGSALTGTLLQRDFTVVGFDPDPQRRAEFTERGGAAVESVGAVAAAADRILLALPTSDISREVCLGPEGLASTATAGTVVMDATTARPSDSVAINAAMAEHSIDYLDTAISGSSVMAWERDIVVMVGGPGPALERVRPVLAAAARSVRHVGGSGAGARTKLIVNLMLGAHRVVLAEALNLGEQAGVDLDVLLSTLKDSAAYSKAMDGWGSRMVTGDHDNPMSRIRQHAKDVRLILEEGHRAGAPLWMASTVSQVLGAAQALGLGDADNSGVMAVYRQLAAASRPPQEQGPA
jgi:3-hydroxyisobutyrate dehydrogenase-like beta-hydroxyacid dehydrogenase